MLTSQKKKKLYILLEGLCENTLSEDQFSQLDQWLRSDREVREIYIHYLQMWADLPYLQESLLSQVHHTTKSIETLLCDKDQSSVDWSDTAIWQALLEAERTSPGIARVVNPPELKPLPRKEQTSAPSKINRFWPFMTLASTAALVLVLILPLTVTPTQEVATLTDCVEAQWDPIEPTIFRGQRLMTQRTLRLQRGIVRLEFDAGAKVIVEAPAVFELLSTNRMSFDSGRLRALAPDKAQGFTVETPSSKIIDLGTEFGVTVPRDGRTLAAVFDGSVKVFSRQATRQDTVVQANKQVSVSKEGRLGPIENLNEDHAYLHSWEEELGLEADTQAAKATNWTHAGLDNLWSTPANWDTSMLPTSADQARINMVPGPTIANEGAVAKTVGVISSELTVDGGTFTTIAWVTVRGTDSILTMNSGTLTAGTSLNISEGATSSATLNINGGTITTRGSLRIGKNDGTGHVNLYGGTINTNRLELRWQGGVGTMDIRAGTLIMNGDAVSTVQGYIDNGWITAYDGGGTLHLDYDVTNPGKTTLSATSRLDPNPIP